LIAIIVDAKLLADAFAMKTVPMQEGRAETAVMAIKKLLGLLNKQ